MRKDRWGSHVVLNVHNLLVARFSGNETTRTKIGRFPLEVLAFPERKKPEPPVDMPPRQVAEWRAVVGRMPFDWFQRETFALLVAFCRHVDAAWHVAQLIEQAQCADSLIIDDYQKLLAENAEEGNRRAIASLATKLRLTNQSRYEAKGAARQAGQFSGRCAVGG